MTPTIVQRAVEYRDIHLAVCRYRRQGLCCSTCDDLAERVERLAARVRHQLVSVTSEAEAA